MVILALSWEDIFSPLSSATQAVTAGALSFAAYVKCLIFSGFYTSAISLLDLIPTSWRTHIDTGFSGITKVYEYADIFIPMQFCFNCISFCAIWTLSFWTFKFLCRLEILGFKLGG